jgi:hypothetical protein
MAVRAELVAVDDELTLAMFRPSPAGDVATPGEQA